MYQSTLSFQVIFFCFFCTSKNLPFFVVVVVYCLLQCYLHKGREGGDILFSLEDLSDFFGHFLIVRFGPPMFYFYFIVTFVQAHFPTRIRLFFFPPPSTSASSGVQRGVCTFNFFFFWNGRYSCEAGGSEDR